jgi:hypothetical protein
VYDRVLEEQGFEKLAAKVLTSITNDGSKGTKSVENICLYESDHNLVIVGLGGHNFYAFGDIIHSY